jgi:hypothetical protein
VLPLLHHVTAICGIAWRQIRKKPKKPHLQETLRLATGAIAVLPFLNLHFLVITPSFNQRFWLLSPSTSSLSNNRFLSVAIDGHTRSERTATVRKVRSAAFALDLTCSP